MSTLAELGAISKAQQQQYRINKPSDSQKAGALQGAGGVALGGGLLAGGIPGAKVKPGAKWTKPKSWKGGIFGFREQMHKDALDDFQKKSRGVRLDQGWHAEQFTNNRRAGKIVPEKRVIGHMRKGRRLGYAATAAGAAALGAGTYLKRRTEEQHEGRVRKADKWRERYEDRRSSRYMGAGATLAAGGLGAGSLLTRQQKKWKDVESRALGEAAAHAPGDPSRSIPRLTATKPVNSHDAWNKWRPTLDAATPKGAQRAGELHGRASQARYFSNAYKWNAKGAKAAGLAGLGVAGAGMAMRRKEIQRREAEKARRRR